MRVRDKGRVIAEVTDGMRELLRKAGSNDWAIARVAQRELAIALQVPLREGVLDGDIVGPYGIFVPEKFEPGTVIEYPLDFLSPGTESEYVAFTMPNYGRIPEKHIEGDYVTIPTYDIGAAIDWALKYARDARWPVVTRAMAVLEAMFVRKMNVDAWHTIIATGVDRNVLVFDSAAPAGFLTKRLLSLMKSNMRRSGGGNITSLNPFKLTDVWMSIENVEDMRSWDLTQIDDVTRREIFLGEQDGGIQRVFGVNIHELTELGASQAFQTYFTSLGGSLNGTDTELVIGLDLSPAHDGSFVMPVRQEVEIFEDETLHRSRRVGYYGWAENGLACLDNRTVIFASN